MRENSEGALEYQKIVSRKYAAVKISNCKSYFGGSISFLLFANQ